MNEGESLPRKKRRKTAEDILKIDLSTSKIKMTKNLKESLPPIKGRRSNLIVPSSQNKNRNADSFFNKRKKKISFLPGNRNRHSIFVVHRNNALDYANFDNLNKKRKTQEEIQIQKFYQVYNLNENINTNNNILIKRNNEKYNLNESIKLNKIEENVRNIINNIERN